VLGTNPWFKKPRAIGEKVGKLQGKCIGEKVGKLQGKCKGFAWGRLRINL